MFLWPRGEKIIFLKFSGFGMEIEGGQNTVSTAAPSLFDISSAIGAVR